MNEALLEPFTCHECKSIKCVIQPILSKYTETQEGGLHIKCAECDEELGNVALTSESWNMILQVEKMNLETSLEEETTYGKN